MLSCSCGAACKNVEEITTIGSEGSSLRTATGCTVRGRMLAFVGNWLTASYTKCLKVSQTITSCGLNFISEAIFMAAVTCSGYTNIPAPDASLHWYPASDIASLTGSSSLPLYKAAKYASLQRRNFKKYKVSPKSICLGTLVTFSKSTVSDACSVKLVLSVLLISMCSSETSDAVSCSTNARAATCCTPSAQSAWDTLSASVGQMKAGSST
mmetsp:Transcript_56869/g.106896  ORF Transcript_56869/g.106896 Transcript_56869/m.106896 type:complete len:211 (+) Transcript_56869:308-940(+)